MRTRFGDRQRFDNWITGHYGEDQFRDFPEENMQSNFLQVDGGYLEVRASLTDLPSSIPEAGEQYFMVCEAIKKLEARADVLKAHLINKIPIVSESKESIVEGVRHSSFIRNDTSWKKACTEIMNELVPKTKLTEAEIIINGNTRSSTIHKLERAS